MKWPRGKYNGQRIAGLDFRLRMNLFWWYWIPRIEIAIRLPRWCPARWRKRWMRTHYCYASHFMFHWLCVHLWIGAEYEH
jgi:hypothetical protein